MSTITFMINTFYGHIVSISIKFLVHVYDTFSIKGISRENLVFEDKEALITQTQSENIEKPTTFKTLNEVLSSKIVSENIAALSKNMIMYIANTSVSVYKNPTIEFDTKIGSVSYGEMVTTLDVRGRFHKIVWNNMIGWVLKDDLVNHEAHIYPNFLLGEENLFDDKNTLCVRAVLKDMFGVGNLDFSLQAGEYVLYKLSRNNIHIEWPEMRPRTPGLWHKILKGVPKIHIGVVPKENMIMEYIFDDEIGHVVYVEKVLQDDTISISEINYPDSGTYSERILTKEEWKELRPVFIEAQ